MELGKILIGLRDTSCVLSLTSCELLNISSCVATLLIFSLYLELKL